MKLSRSLRRVKLEVEDAFEYAAEESRLVMRNVGLVSAGITVLAVSVVVGRELRQRYKFSRRTPYDMYAHSGDIRDRFGEREFGVGI